MRKLILGIFVTLFLMRADFMMAATEQIKIVATTSTFASIAKDIVGDRAEIYFIASPKRDIHFISPTPKDVMKVKKCDVFIHGGLDLEIWRGSLLDAVGRIDLMEPTGKRQIDLSKGISLLEIPETLSRAEGDIHAYGNPHYWLDPENGKIIAQNIAEGLARIYPEDAEFFQKNLLNFNSKMETKFQEWKKQLAPYYGAGVVTYHDSWPYFLQRFGFVTVGFLEPKPGIPPTPKHLAKLEQIMKEKKAKVIIKEVYHPDGIAKKMALETGARGVVLAMEVGEGGSNYFSFMDENIRRLVEGF